MPLPLLDINDSNLQLWGDDEPLRSPGYALLNGQRYIFGNPARAAARLRPREINTRFWWQLNTEPLQPALGPARHSADMVHAHLLDIHEQAGKPDELLLAVSGTMQRDQLALLLGIIQQCPFSAVGLVNRSIALGSLYDCNGRLFHLEIQLHQAVITALGQNDGNTELLHTTPLPGCGLLQLQERLVEPIASAFIRQTRYDPRRQAQSEQQLYDALPDALRALDTGSESNLEVNGYRARIERGELVKAGERLFSALAQAIGPLQPGDRVLLDPIAALLPGLLQEIPAAEVVENDALWKAVGRHGERLVQREQALSFVTSLPCLAQPGVTPKAAAPPAMGPGSNPESAPVAEMSSGAKAPSPATPTHLLLAASARPLAARGTPVTEGCELYQHNGLWLLRGPATGGTQVNGLPYREGQALVAGDTVSCGEHRAALIEVLP
jgi:hypothetical protein